MQCNSLHSNPFTENNGGGGYINHVCGLLKSFTLILLGFRQWSTIMVYLHHQGNYKATLDSELGFH